MQNDTIAANGTYTNHNQIGLQLNINIKQQLLSLSNTCSRHARIFSSSTEVFLRTYCKRHDKINHALFVITLSSAQTVPLIHYGALAQALWDSHVCPCDAIIHGKRPLSTNTQQPSVRRGYCQNSYHYI